MINDIRLTFFEKLLLFFLVLSSFFLTLGSIPLFDLDEGAFSEATREMLLNKNFITTYLNGELRFDKPILIYWFQSISVSLFGLNEFALRLPSAISSLLWVSAIFLFTKKYFNFNSGLYAALAFIASLQIALISKAAIADAMLNLYITLSMFSIYIFYVTRQNKYIYLTFIFIALGVLTKGPIAVIIPFFVSFLFFLIKNQIKLWFMAILNIRGILIFLAIALPWYILEYMEQGQLFIDGFFLKHNISRFSSSLEGHTGNYLYYIPVLFIGLMPFTGVLVKSFSNFRNYLKDDTTLFLLIWFIFVFVFFTFSNTKLPHYIIYGYTPLFIIIGITLSSMIDEKKQYFTLLFIPSIILFLLFLSFPFLLSHIRINNDFANSLIPEFIKVFNQNYQLTLIIAIVLLIIVSLIRNISFFKRIIFISFISIIIINFLVLPTIGKVLQQPIKNIALFAKERQLKVLMYRLNMPSFNVYREDYIKKRNPLNGDIVIMKKIHLNDFLKYTILYEDTGIVLVKILKIN